MTRADSPGDLTRPHTHTQVGETNRSHPSSAPLLVARARGFQNETDPLPRFFETLSQHGCQPKGPLHHFRANCPAHDSDSPSLVVREGADGRVLVACKVGCVPQAVLDALGLKWADLFPAGHRNARRQRPRPVKTLTKGAAFLDQMAGAGHRWVALVCNTTCPYCDSPNAYLEVHDRGGLDVHCPSGCGFEEVRRAVETRAAIAEKGGRP